MRNLRIGTCSWKYPSWHGLVYSKPEGIDYLEEYARRYDTVEIDQWFWSLFPQGKVRLPALRDAESYRKAVPANFRFTVKAPNSLTLTHHYPKESGKGKNALGEPNPHFLSKSLMTDFHESIAPLHDVLGPVILQFEYLNRNKMASQDALEKALESFASGLHEKAKLGVEIRNANYLNDRFFAFLRDQDFIPVLLEGYWMPPVADVHEKNKRRLEKFKTIILRLHGKDRDSMEDETGNQWNRIVRPADEALQRLAQIVAEWMDWGTQVFVNVNNHYEGSAPLTIERFRKCLRD
jgi:uncharacterized protein YecE (DUF72 family)